MTVAVVFPKSGMGIEEGTVIRWTKNAGDRIEVGEPLVEIETAKAVQEVEAPASGILTTILVTANQTVAVHATLALIEEFV